MMPGGDSIEQRRHYSHLDTLAIELQNPATEWSSGLDQA